MRFAECIDSDADDEKVPHVNPPTTTPQGGHWEDGRLPAYCEEMLGDGLVKLPTNSSRLAKNQDITVKMRGRDCPARTPTAGVTNNSSRRVMPSQEHRVDSSDQLMWLQSGSMDISSNRMQHRDIPR